MKILIEESVLRQALEALGRMERYGDVFPCKAYEEKPYDQVCTAITALRSALDAAEKVEPAIDPNCTCDEYGACAYCWNGKKHDKHAPAVPEETK